MIISFKQKTNKLKDSVYLNMAIFLIGKLVSVFGARILNFAIGLYVLKITGSGMSFALTMIVSTIPAIIISPFAGVIADRVNRKTVVVATDAFSGALLVLIYLISLKYGLSLNLILITVFSISILNTFFSVTMEASIPNIVDQKRLTKINSYSSSITSLASIIGPAIGGLIYGLFPIEKFLLIAGISFIISAISELFINFNFNNIEVSPKIKASVLSEIRSAIGYVKTNKILLVVLIFAAFINFAFSGYSVSLPHIINIQLKLTSKQYGLIQSAFAVGSLLSSVLYSFLSEKQNNYNYLIYSLITTSILMMLSGVPTLNFLSFISSTGLLIYFMVINFSIGAALMFLNLPIFILLQRKTSDEYRGRINGLLGTTSLSIQPLGMILGGLFIDYLSGFILVLICGLLFLITSIIFSKLNIKSEFD